MQLRFLCVPEVVQGGRPQELDSEVVGDMLRAAGFDVDVTVHNDSGEIILKWGADAPEGQSARSLTLTAPQQTGLRNLIRGMNRYVRDL